SPPCPSATRGRSATFCAARLATSPELSRSPRHRLPRAKAGATVSFTTCLQNREDEADATILALGVCGRCRDLRPGTAFAAGSLARRARTHRALQTPPVHTAQPPSSGRSRRVQKAFELSSATVSDER